MFFLSSPHTHYTTNTPVFTDFTRFHHLLRPILNTTVNSQPTTLTIKMRYSVAVAALVATASASYNYTTPAAPVYPVYTTEVVTGYETYCPSATEITHGGKTYTVTEATTLTITDCPCTITKPVETPAYTPAPVETPVYSSAAPVETPVYSSPAPYYPSTNGTSVAPPAPTGTTPAATTAPPAFTGAASKASVGLAAVLGFAAYLL
jgi:hypothetical protein